MTVSDLFDLLASDSFHLRQILRFDLLLGCQLLALCLVNLLIQRLLVILANFRRLLFRYLLNLSRVLKVSFVYFLILINFKGIYLFVTK